MSICLSCGHQRDSCEICGGDLEDAHVYCDALRSELEQVRGERDALRAEGVAMRGACLVACNTCGEFPDADREQFIPRYPSCVEEGCIVYQALSAPLTAAAAERVKAMERVCEVAKRTINCDKWGTAECSYDCQGKNWDVCEALAALDAKGEA